MFLTLLATSCGPATGSSLPGGSSVEPGSSEGPSSEEGPGFDPESIHANITFWNTSSYGDVIDTVIASFNEIYPNIQVNNVKQTGGYDDLGLMVVQGVAANNYPNLVVAYPDYVAEFIDYNIAVDLDPFMNHEVYGWTEEDLEDIIPTYLDQGQHYVVEGTYSVPYCVSSETMYYNEDVLIGLNLASVDATINGGQPLDANYLNNLTWEELFGKLAPAIIEYDQEVENILVDDSGEKWAVFGYDSDDNLFITLAEQYGYGYTGIDAYGNGQVLFEEDDDMKNLMKVFNDAHQKGYIMTKGTYSTYTNYAFVEQQTLFSVGSTGGSKYQKSDLFNTGVAKIPHAEGKDPRVILQGPSLAVLDHGDETQNLATWLFYKHLANEQNSVIWATETGYYPIRYSTYTSDAYLDMCNYTDKADHSIERVAALVAAYGSEIADDMYSSPVFKGSSECRTQAGSIVTQCLNETNLTDERLDQIFTEAADECRLAM